MLKNLEFVFIPVVNPDGYVVRGSLSLSFSFSLSLSLSLTHSLPPSLSPILSPPLIQHTWTVDRLWRKNRNTNGGSGTCIGVDINRNFPTGFEGSPSSKVCWRAG